MIRYELKGSNDPHWNAFWEEVLMIEGEIEYPVALDKHLKKYKGKIYFDPTYQVLQVTKGIEFSTEEDLLFFKLKFN